MGFYENLVLNLKYFWFVNTSSDSQIGVIGIHPSAFMGLIWILVLFLTVIIYNLVEEEEEKLINIKDKCPSGDYPHQYLVMMCFGQFTPKFSIDTTFQFELYNRKYRLITRFIAPPKVLKKHCYRIDLEKKAIRFMMSRQQPLEKLAFVRLAHNCYTNSVFVYTFEMQNLDTDQTFSSKISSHITPIILTQHQLSYQCFKLRDVGPPLDIKARPSATINWFEYIVFLFLWLNTIPFLNMFFVFCTEKQICWDFPENWNIWLLFDAIVSNLISFIVVLVSIIVYKFLKEKRFRSISPAFWLYVNTLYLSFNILVGFLLGLSVSFQQLFKNQTKKSVEIHNITLLISYLILIVISIPSLVYVLYLIDRKPKHNYLALLHGSHRIKHFSEILSESENSKRSE